MTLFVCLFCSGCTGLFAGGKIQHIIEYNIITVIDNKFQNLSITLNDLSKTHNTQLALFT